MVASSVLRAFLADVAVELTGHAAVLDYLQQRGFAAAHVKRTSDGALLACYQGWTALLVSFLEGEVADFALHSLNLLSSCAGRLHTLSHDALTEAESVRLPDSVLRPTQPASHAIDNLIQALPARSRRAAPILRRFHHGVAACAAGTAGRTSTGKDSSWRLLAWQRGANP